MTQNIQDLAATHPSQISSEDAAAARALIDEEDLLADDLEAAGGTGTGTGTGEGEGGGTGTGTGDGEGTGTDEGTGEGAGAGEGEAAAAAAATEGAGAGEEDAAKAGVLRELIATRSELRQAKKALEAMQHERGILQAHVPAARDFAAERAALHQKWDAGDINTAEYNDQRDALVISEAEYRSELRFAELHKSAATAGAQKAELSTWEEKSQAWVDDNKDFLANPLRRNAFNQLLAELEADPANTLDDDALLKKAEELAYDAFNWEKPQPAGAGAGAAGPATGASPRAVAAARAASAAAAAPPIPAAGASAGLVGAKINLDDLKPGEFKKLTRAQQAEALDGEL